MLAIAINLPFNLPSLSQAFSSSPQAIWFYAAADILLVLVYYFAFTSLTLLLRKKPGLNNRWSLVFFGVFFLFAGTLHAFNVLAPWYRVYWIQSIFKLMTAVMGLAALIVMIRFVFKMLSLPDTQRLRGMIKKTTRRITVYRKAWKGLQEKQKKLEASLNEKDQALIERNKAFEKEAAERKQLQNGISFLPGLMKEVSEAGDFHTALEIVLKRMCEGMGWDYGEVWVPRTEGKVLESSSVWYGAESLKGFHEVSRELRFPPGIGLPGRAWALKRPIWMQDVTDHTSQEFMRFSLTEEFGFKSALSVPVMAQDKLSAVLVLFAHSSRPEEEWSLHLVNTIAAQLGSVVRRKFAEEALSEAYEQLEKRIKERTEGLTKINETLRQEIAERKVTEEALKNSEKNYLTLVNSIDGIVWEYDLQNQKFLFVSEQAERILGYPVEAWLGDSTFWQDHIHGKNREAAILLRAHVADKKQGDQFEYRMISSDGRVIWFRDMVTVVVENGRTVRLRGVMVDITDEKHVEEALNQERNFASAVLDTAGALVMILDPEGRIVRFNRAWEQASGYALAEVKGKYLWDLFLVPEEVGKIKAIFTRLLAGQFPATYESYWVAKDGSRRIVSWSNTVLLNRDNSIAHIIATGIDFTKRKEAEEKLKEAVSNLARSNEELDRYSGELKGANERLQKLDELKSHFISAASHELRTPLTAIKGYAETIAQEEAGPLNRKQKEFLNYIREATERLHRLLTELLDISRIESGRVKMEVSETNLRDLLKEELTIFKPQATEKEQSLVLETDNELRIIYCDADKIREVMDNLISNAIKYTPRRGTIKIRARNFREGVQIDVEDTGIGIRKENLSQIFEPFQHIEKNGTDYEESTGLGLTLAKRIVEVHEGEIRVQSEEGRGSKFTVILPPGHKTIEAKKTGWVVAT